jgi:signal transduction histidine kinase
MEGTLMQHDASMHDGSEAGGFFGRLFNSSDFMARTFCFNKDPQVIWLHLTSDLIITLAYYSIPIALVYLVMKRRDLAFNWMFVLFGGFILLCGTTHLFNIFALTTPMYRLDGVIKAITAAFSIATAVALWPLIPKILALPSQAALREANIRLESEVTERQAAQEKVQHARDELEHRVEERTAELALHREKLAELVAQRTAELEASHQQLRVSERMVAIGTLSAGLGHDMGNLLLPVRARLDSIEARIDEGGVPEGIREDVGAIRTCAEYLHRLARGLRLLALDPDDVGGETELLDWWQDVSPMLENVLPRNIKLAVELGSSPIAVKIARHGLTQAVFNLVQNAGDAMRSQGGLVTVWARPGKESGSVDVGVTDNGPGMTEEVRQRCLEPFFTTKIRGISTGLGLALVHGIVQRAGGSIDIQTQLGKGCTFVLKLKAAQAEAPPLRPLAAISVGDQRVRGYAEGVLRALGFEPAACDGAPPERATLWIVEAPQAENIRMFLDADKSRKVVVLGPGEDFKDDRVIRVGDPSKPTEVRRAIERAMET